MVGIVTNNAALFAQRNLQDAASSSELSIGRLSSGNRIIRAADDVSGLAIGTVLATNVSTLKTVLTSASQAQSLLQIADGGLKNIGDILQRQKALAVQANSGSLSDNERAYLNEEFQNLVSEVDRLVSSTTFNGISLLDGSILNTAAVGTNTADAGTSASTTITIDNTVTAGDHLVFSDGTEFRQVTFSATGGGDYSIDMGAGSKAQAQSGLLAFLQSDAVQNDSFFQKFTFGTSFSSNVLTVSAKNTGTGGNSLSIAAVAASGQAAASNIDIGGAAAATLTAFTGGTNGDLAAGRTSYDTSTSYGDSIISSYAAQATDVYTFTVPDTTQGDSITLTINGETQTFTFGTLINNLAVVGDAEDDAITLADAINKSSLSAYVNASVDPAAPTVVRVTALTPGAITITPSANTNISAGTHAVTGAGGGVHVDNIVNNDAFVGVLSGFTATYLASDKVQASITVGDYTYTATIDDTTPGADKFIRFASEGTGVEGGGFFDVYLESSSTQAVTNQADANTFAARLNAAFSTISFEQTRDVDADSYLGAGNIYVGTTQTGSLASSSVDLNLKGFSSLDISDIRVTAPSSGSTEAKIEVELQDGRVFSLTDLGSNTSDTNPAAYTRSIQSGATLILSNEEDSDETITLTFGTGTLSDSDGHNDAVVLVETAAQAAAFEDALGAAFGLGNGGLSFQTGITTSDSIAVSLGSAQTTDLYADNDGLYTSLSIDTAENASTAADVLDNAINTVTTLRATVGALQSRFNFASANITTSIQNQEAARADFLDVDIAAESTDFAQAQVRLQASISVLAQANQIPQNLLKLIG